jgi:serine/threonine protein phosphatase 1
MNRKIIIGDIHGCFAELTELLHQVGVSADDHILGIGDAVDRGPDSVKVLEFLRARPNTLALVGNHERKHLRGIYSYSQEITKLQFGAAYADAVVWMSTLPYFIEVEEAIIVHAAMLPGVPLREQRPEVLCGSTSGEKFLAQELNGQPWYERYEGPKPIIFGHHVYSEGPFIHRDLAFGIDTGACHGGSLTAIVLPEFKLYSVKARDNYWSQEKHEWRAKVLQARPWEDMDWAQLRTELRRCRRLLEDDSPEAVDSLKQWVEQSEALLRQVLDAVEQEYSRWESIQDRREFALQVKDHPLATLLFLRRTERLNQEVLKRACSSPRKLFLIARSIGLKTPAIPVGRT